LQGVLHLMEAVFPVETCSVWVGTKTRF
jgi:hypothetical protein